MLSHRFDLPDESATLGLGASIGRLAMGQEQFVVYLRGQLGAGKTCMTRGILTAYEYSGPVKSPTYTLVEPYDLIGRQVFHFDLYRLAEPEELEFIGIRDYFAHKALIIIEWPEKGGDYLPSADFDVTIAHGQPARKSTVTAHSDLGRQVFGDFLSRINISG